MIGPSSGLAGAPHPEEERLSRAIASGLLHLDDPDRLRATTEPFVCLGFATYESHEGERPMAIRWRLEREIPAAWLPVMALAV